MRWLVVLTVEDREGRNGVEVVGQHTEVAVVEAEDVDGAYRQLEKPPDTLRLEITQTMDARTLPDWDVDEPVEISVDGSRIKHKGDE